MEGTDHNSMEAVQIFFAGVQDKAVLRALLELCQHDYSEFNGEEVDEHGLYGYPYLDHYWTEPGRYPVLMKVNGKWAGFALVRRLSEVDQPPLYAVAEFFILRKYRRKGLGTQLAFYLFDSFAGEWRVGQEPGNLPAQAFWRKQIAEYTGGRFEDLSSGDAHWQGPLQVFRSAGRG